MSRLENFVKDWSILIFLSGVVLVGLAPTLSNKTVLLFSIPSTKQSMTWRPFQIVDETGAKIGWWQIKLDPTSVMIGDSADLEVTYAANPELFHPPLPQGSSRIGQYRDCIETAENQSRWHQTPVDCGPPPPPENTGATNLPVPQHRLPPPIESLRAKILHSDLPYAPGQDAHEFDLKAIFQSGGRTDNHIWHLTADAGKAEPGLKSVILAFHVTPNSYQQQELKLNGQSVVVNGSEVPVKFSVRTPTGLPRQVGAICTTVYTALGAIGSSVAFLVVLKYWLRKRKDHGTVAGRSATFDSVPSPPAKGNLVDEKIAPVKSTSRRSSRKSAQKQAEAPAPPA